MTADQTVEEVLHKLASGEAVDWDRAERSTTDPDEAALLQQLRILERLAGIHRTIQPSPAVPPEEETREGPQLRWGRYRLVREIGAGSYGSVYLAHDEELDRDIAIKLLHSSLVRTDMASRVRQEGRALARVRHPNVITVHDVEEHEQQLGLCMEYIDGHTLADLVRTNGPLNADEALPIAEAVCRGLAAVHDAGLLHRDIKASNVMRERAGRIVLMDFGAGLDVTAQGSAPAIGTPTYMAPEVLNGRPASPVSDVYAVGVLLYFLVTGAYPVSGKSTDDIRAAHAQGKRRSLVERRPDLPADFLDAIERATAADPRSRLSSPAALLQALRSEHPPSPWPPRLKRTATLAIGLLALATISGLLTTVTFNAAVDRSAAFDPDNTFLSRVVIGVQSLLTPLVVMCIVLGIGAALNLVLRLIPAPRRLMQRGALALSSWFDEAERAAVLAQILVVIGIVAVALMYVVFHDVIFSFASSISIHPLERFAPLASQERRLFYRYTLPPVLLFIGLGWLRVRRLRRDYGGRIPGWVYGAGAAVVVVLVVMSQAPYKLMAPGQNLVPVVLVDGVRCYRLGVSGEEVRVFCPAWPVPRVRTVKSTERVIQRCEFEENVFIAQPAGGCEPATAGEGRR